MISMSTKPQEAARKFSEYLRNGVCGIFLFTAVGGFGGFMKNGYTPFFASIERISNENIQRVERAAKEVQVRVLTRFDAIVTAYSSTPEETDSTPFISADGNQVYDGLIACPRKYPFGTLFRIAGKVYRCGDRLNQKFDDRFDIWKATKEEAIHHGTQVLSTEIVELSP